MTTSGDTATLRLVHPHGTFGPTFQGEGPSAGRRAVFVRMVLCNLRCRRCDTPETWDTTRYDLRAGSRRASTAEVLEWVRGQDAELVVLTGGEPLIQQAALVPLVRRLADDHRRVEVETNGTFVPLPALMAAVSRFTVSPKLSAFGAGMTRRRRIVPEALRAFAACGKAVFKFVVDPAGLDEVASLADEFDLSPVWVMPEGSTSAAVLRGLRELAEPVLARGWNLTSRLHVLLWEDDRGR
ncbi:7-carboxy-7-deazaguanine synthase QueE [Actinosynnema sp. CA-299493]